MAVKIFPTFETRVAFTVRALYRYCGLQLPNINYMPDSKDKDILAEAACKQVAKMVKNLLSNKDLRNIMLKHHNMLFIPSSVLFPQLGLIGPSKAKKPWHLKNVWGWQYKGLIRLLAKLPTNKVVFYLDAADDIGDVDLLSQLAHHPYMIKHTVLMSRPILAEYYQAQLIHLANKKRKKSTKIQRQFQQVILQVNYEQLRKLKRQAKSVRNVQRGIDVGSFVILD